MLKRRLTKYDKKMMEFNKRYDKFKKNNLPTSFWDEERLTHEYVYFDSSGDHEDGLRVRNNLYNAFEDFIIDSFYYPFNYHFYGTVYDEKTDTWSKGEHIGHSHEHDFDRVIEALYDSPETFSIDLEDEHYYSEQELRFLKKLQSYLLFIGLKDWYKGKAPVSRYRNKKRKKYENVYVIDWTYKTLKNVLEDGLNYTCYPKGEYSIAPREYKKGECQKLIMDKNYKFIMFVEYTKKEEKEYKDVKKYYQYDLKDDDKVIVDYFNILERFD